MKILLLGSTGRLGHKIAQKFSEKQIEFIDVNRKSLENFENFKCLLEEIFKHSVNQTILILDVSLSEVTHKLANYLHQMNLQVNQQSVGLVVGTTGHSEECKSALKGLSQNIPVCVVPNFSKGIFLFNQILRTMFGSGKSLKTLAEQLGFEISLTDIHHVHKKDSPSGTALQLSSSLGLDPQSIHSVRLGEVIGEHSIVFKTESEALMLYHSVSSRDVFADGAFDVCLHFFEKISKPGMYSIDDIFKD